MQPYLHDSRHKHASRRVRGPGGRFLTADEVRASQDQQQHESSPGSEPRPSDPGPAVAKSPMYSRPALHSCVQQGRRQIAEAGGSRAEQSLFTAAGPDDCRNPRSLPPPQ